MAGSEFPPEERPTKPRTLEHEAQRMLRNWAACDDDARRVLSDLAVLLRTRAVDGAKR